MKYHISIRVLHWLMALIIIALLISGSFAEDLPKDYKPLFYFWHKSFGMVIFFLVFIRFSAKLIKGFPPYPDNFSKAVVTLAKLGHLGLYFLMFAMPFTGYVMSMAGDHGVNMFGLIDLPNLVGINKDLGKSAYELHEFFGNIFIFILIGHVAAVVLHLVKDKVNLIDRMW